MARKEITRIHVQSLCRFSPANLENMFSKYAHTVPDRFTLGELWQMTEGNRLGYDFFGWYALSGP